MFKKHWDAFKKNIKKKITFVIVIVLLLLVDFLVFQENKHYKYIFFFEETDLDDKRKFPRKRQ